MQGGSGNDAVRSLHDSRDRNHRLFRVEKRTQELVGSEFVEACNGKSYPALISVLDQHMEAIKAIYPREYDSLMDKIRALG